MAFHRDDRHIAVGDDHGVVRLITAKSFTTTAQFTTRAKMLVASIATDPLVDMIAIQDYTGLIYLWNGDAERPRIPAHRVRPFASVALSQNKMAAIVPTDPYRVQVVTLRDEAEALITYATPDIPVPRLHLSRDATVLIAAHRMPIKAIPRAYMWRLGPKESITRIEHRLSFVSDISIASNLQFVAFAGQPNSPKDSALFLRDIRNAVDYRIHHTEGTAAAFVKRPRGTLFCCSFSPGADLLAVGGESGSATVWRFATR